MTTWIETTKKQSGKPLTQRIRIAEKDVTIQFTEDGYAEIEDDEVAALLVNNIESIREVQDPR